MLNERYDDEDYLDHKIRVYVKRYDSSSSWVIDHVDVQGPDGRPFPPLGDADHSWDTVEQALVAGSVIGRRFVDAP
jgi:hypothetical protein